ncbi:septum site-determining protein MinC [Peptacetobacter hominis]|uniref:septum site-determining protein MinC n=1 Tax=Peptacetobacter hominis TaxID=2743610 RepID=UPI001581A8DC|nr:septum site-determining protein MinC [Peptacetobacter hominis]
MNDDSRVDKIEFKGCINGITIVVSDLVDTNEIIESISDKIQKSKSFFKGAKVCSIESEHSSESDLNCIKESLKSRFNIEFVKPSEHIEADKHIKNEKLIVSDKDDKIIKENSENKTENEDVQNNNSLCDSIKFVNVLRSGASEEYKGNVIVMSDMKSGSKVVSEGDILVMGNIYPGAKAVANGNVVVMGKLSGFVHAGASGNRGCYIAAKSLKPTILQIADVIAEAPEEIYDSDEESVSEIAFISEDRIIIDMQS